MRGSFYFLALYTFQVHLAMENITPEAPILCFWHGSESGITQRASGNSELPWTSL